jgi:uncharacterized protein (DUF433 family)
LSIYALPIESLPASANHKVGGCHAPHDLVKRTRIPVWVLVQARQLGASESDLLRDYPALRAEDLANAWAYARAHREEIEQQIACNFDLDYAALAQRIHDTIAAEPEVSGRLVRVNRPG